MKLIADGGSTKTEWCLCSEGNLLKRFYTGGMNPYILDDDSILHILRTTVLPQTVNCDITEIHYYGAGCRDIVIPRMKVLFASVFTSPDVVINIYSDMLASARALFGDEKGIACILGTGSNSCYYDGEKIADTVPPMGFILGDEGSGANIGRQLVNAIFKRRMPEDICKMFVEETGLTLDEVMRRTYTEKEPGRFLASLTHFVADHIDCTEVRAIVKHSFEDFFKNNIAAYNKKGCKIGAIGSIAYYFSRTLHSTANEQGYTITQITKSPIEGLIKYHS